MENKGANMHDNRLQKQGDKVIAPAKLLPYFATQLNSLRHTEGKR